jgi:hypothetical protein
MRPCPSPWYQPAPQSRGDWLVAPNVSRRAGFTPANALCKNAVFLRGGRALAAYGPIDRVPMRRDLLQGAGRGQCSFLQPSVHLFNVREPLLKFADPLTEGADFLRDGLEVLQGREMIRSGLANRQAGQAPAGALKNDLQQMVRSCGRLIGEDGLARSAPHDPRGAVF